jgi:hypothetical protein
MIGIGIGIPRYYNLGGATPPPEPVYLLDFYSTDLVAAYGPRRLNSNYNGPCITIAVINGSPTPPQFDIGFDGNGDLDTAAILSATGNVNSAVIVKIWDQTNNSRHFLQPDLNIAPRIFTSIGFTGELVIENGRPAFSFDFTGVEMATAEFTAINQPVSFFMVNKATNATGFMVDGNAANSFAVKKAGVTNEILMTTGTGGVGTTGYNTSAANLIYAAFNLTSSVLQLNNNAVVTGTVGAGSFSKINLGSNGAGANNMFGSFSELIVFSSTKSADKDGIRANMNSYYNNIYAP